VKTDTSKRPTAHASVKSAKIVKTSATSIAERTEKCISGLNGEAFPAEELLKRDLKVSWSDSEQEIPSPE
jgi:hypothetical protein